MSEFSKKYEPSEFENRIYKEWEDEKLFEPKPGKTGETFFLPMPPPNVTWVLHLGHALTLSVEDIMTRYHRMKWDETLWLPWTDHAWIATQAKVEQKLASEWKTKYDLWREKFLQEAFDYKDKYGSIITNQMRKMWASASWENERFTLDDGLAKRVKKTFVELHNRWLVYKGEYMVNYSPALQTVLSDAEVIYKDEKAKLYYITYFVSGSDKEVIVATTRPETLLWDVAVAVHPKDKEMKKLLKAGKKLILPIVNKEIPLIADEMVDIEFWTGAVKITPAHDKNDFEVAMRHNLPLDKVVLDKDWKMTKMAWIFEGQDYLTARKNIVELLKAKWNLVKIEDYDTKVWYCERSGCRVETIISKQWFVKTEPMIKKVLKGYKAKEFEVMPARYGKTFEDWMYNLKDWCISRQLWWWHQIPAYYHNETGEMVVTEEDMSNNPDYTQDPDVLDTWFSSGLWPMSTLDYNMWDGKQSDLFEKFYPANMLETGHDIIFFWCIRMLLFWYEFTEQTPIKKFYMHGLVRDKEGRKMSKSLWNWIDPLDVIKEHWTDALRMALTIWNTPWNNLNFDMDNVVQNKFFINKLWNATRFVHKNIIDKGEVLDTDMVSLENELKSNYEDLMLHEKWILSKLRNITDETTSDMEKYTFSDCGQSLYTFTKNDFCDYYIEEFKLTHETSKFWDKVITYVINTLLKLWHPYIPFVTEELYEKLGFSGKLISQEWPFVSIESNKEIEKEKEIIVQTIKTIRNIRAENNVPPHKDIKLYFVSKAKNKEILEKSEYLISWMVKSELTEIKTVKPQEWDDYAYWVVKSGIEVYVDTSNALDVEKELTRLKEQITDTKEYINILDKKLLNERFVTNAPKDLVRAEIDKKDKAIEKLEKLEEKYKKLK